MSANRCGIALGIDVHHTTVSRWELLTDASLNQHFRMFHVEQEESWYNVPEPNHVAAVFHGLRADATNANVWQRHTLQHGPLTMPRLCLG